MQYLLEMAPHEQAIAKQAVKCGQPLPNRILNAPVLIQGLGLYLEAFFDLDSERTHAQGITPIPWTSIYQYAKAFDFDEEQTEDLFFFIKSMDNEHLQRLKKQKEVKKG